MSTEHNIRSAGTALMDALARLKLDCHPSDTTLVANLSTALTAYMGWTSQCMGEATKIMLTQGECLTEQERHIKEQQQRFIRLSVECNNYIDAIERLQQRIVELGGEA
jgi:hypothetical protein